MRSLTLTPLEARQILGAFLDTAGTEAGSDELASPELLSDWFRERGLLEADVEITPGDVQHMIRLREALREMNAADADNRACPETVAVLNWASSRAPLRPRVGRRATAWLEPAVDGFDGVIGRLLIIYDISKLKGPGNVRKRRPSVDDRWLTR